MQRLADLCFRRRWAVVVLWSAALAAALVSLQVAPAIYSADYQTPGAEATAAFDLLDERFPARRGDSINIVFFAPDGLATAARQAAMKNLLSAVAAFPHVASVNSPLEPDHSRQLAPDGKTAFAVVNLDRTIDKLANLDPYYQQKFLRMVRPGVRDGLQVEVTHFVSSMALGNETLALIFAAFVLLAAFRSLVAAGLPILTALFGLGTAVACGAGLTRIIDTPDWAATVAAMIGLGVGIDYALFIVTRYRHALSTGLDERASLRAAMATAGRAVFFAGGVVVLSLLGMATMGLGYINGVMTASMIAVGLMLAASLTLLPAILGLVGNNLNRLSIPFGQKSAAPGGSGVWYRWSRAVQRRPWVAFIIGTIVLVVITLPVLHLRFGLPDDGNRPQTETSRRAYDLLTKAFGPGFNGPLLVVIDAQNAAPRPETLIKAMTTLNTLDSVAFVAPPIPNPALNAAILSVYPTSSPQSKETERLVRKLRQQVIPDILRGTGMSAVVGGFTAISIDQANYVMGRLPWFIGTVVFLSFLLLMVLFRSPVVALKAGLMNLLSIAAAYGVMAYAVDDTWLGQLLHIPPTPVPAFVPMIMFAVLFGLSMDYEVFLLSRIREEYERTGDNSGAVADGLAATARVITAAAAIMVFVFGVFIFDPNVFIKQIGLGLTVAILVDATIVRIVLVPSTMELLGKINWWMPRWLDRRLPNLTLHGATTVPAKQAATPPLADK